MISFMLYTALKSVSNGNFLQKFELLFFECSCVFVCRTPWSVLASVFNDCVCTWHCVSLLVDGAGLTFLFVWLYVDQVSLVCLYECVLVSLTFDYHVAQYFKGGPFVGVYVSCDLSFVWWLCALLHAGLKLFCLMNVNRFHSFVCLIMWLCVCIQVPRNYSKRLTDDRTQAGSQAMLLSTGLTPADLKKAQVRFLTPPCVPRVCLTCFGLFWVFGQSRIRLHVVSH